MTTRSVAALGARHDRRWWLSVAARILLIIGIFTGLYAVKQYLGRPAANPGLQRVRLLNPTPPTPPPPPKERPKEEPKPEEKIELAEVPQASNEPPPVDDRLGLDAEADGAGDGFGLAAKPGGRAITTLGGTGSGAGNGSGVPHALEQSYNQALGWRLETYLNRRHELRKRRFRSRLALWISPAGSITRVLFTKAEREKDIEDLLRTALLGMPPLTAPPPGYRQPVSVVVRSENEGGSRTP